MLAFIEICFMCSRTEVESSEKINLGEMCDQKMQMIKNFFKGGGDQAWGYKRADDRSKSELSRILIYLRSTFSR